MQATYSGGDELSRIEHVAHNRSGLWVSIIITVIGLLLFTGIFNFILPNAASGLSGIPLITLGLVLSIVPAIIWIYFFYRLDRLEAEPKHMIFRIVLLGALVAGALHDTLIQNVFTFGDWRYDTWWGHLLGGILIVGFIEMFLIYAVVRYSIFRHPEFNERVDGVIYSVCAGLGLATVLNFQYVMRSDGVDLDIGSIRIVINSLAYASFAGIMGYFLGQTRFEKTPIWYMPAGLALSAVLNGIFFFLLERTFGQGLNYNQWGDLLFATIVAIISLGLVYWLIERANEETLRLAHHAERDRLGIPSPPGLVPVPASTTTSATSSKLTSTSTSESDEAASSTTDTDQEENA